MRADRLVAILLMLQRRDVVTAAEVAEELEISVRTPVATSSRWPWPGCRSTRSGAAAVGGVCSVAGDSTSAVLTAGEARSLFVLVGGRPEVGPEVRSALRKLVRALPEPLREGAEAAAGSVVVDPVGWDRHRGEPRRPDRLDDLEAAVIDGECLHLGYRARSGEVTERVVHPLGLAAKGRNWYLVAGTATGLRTFRADRVERAERTGEPVVRPDGFDLSEAWARIVSDVDQLRTPLEALGTAVPEALPYLRMVLGRRVEVIGDEAAGSDPDGSGPESATPSNGSVRIRIRAANVRALGNDLAGFGSWVRIEEPRELRELLGDIGAELCSLYGRSGAATEESSQDLQES
ncbi:MAG: WYL domain-containing protein [Microthrixaceae bacterium]|nr:WYL domain-containing protein [Microthrixaceae bacterium]